MQSILKSGVCHSPLASFQKRRQELSKQIGITVRNYLLTPEVFRKKLFNEDIKSTVLEFAGKKIEGTLFTDEKTIYDWLKQGGFEQLPDTIEQRVDVIIEKQFHSMRNTLSTKSIDALLPSNVHEVIDRKSLRL